VQTATVVKDNDMFARMQERRRKQEAEQEAAEERERQVNIENVVPERISLALLDQVFVHC
jgi:hypothetical protein